MSYAVKTILMSLILSLGFTPGKSSLPELSDTSLNTPLSIAPASSLFIDKATVIDLFHMVQREALIDLTSTDIQEVNQATEAFKTLVNNSTWDDAAARDFLMKILAFQTGDYQTFRETYERYFPKKTPSELVTLIQGKTYVGSLSRVKGGAFYNLEENPGTLRKMGLMFFPTDFPGITRVVDLTIRGNNLDHLPDMSPWNLLKKLWLYDNKLADLRMLTSLQSLVHLSVHNNYIKDLTGVDKCTALEELCIGTNTLTCLKPLVQLTKLTQLYACTIGTDTSPFDTHSIEKMTQLRALALDGNNLSSAGFLSGHTGLKTLDLHHNKLNDVRPLALLTELTTLDLTNNCLSSVDALTTLHKLERFSAEQNPGNAITTLSQLQALRLERLKPPQTVPAPVAPKAPSEKTPESVASQYVQPSGDVAPSPMFPSTPNDDTLLDAAPPAYQPPQQVPQGPIKRLGKKLTDLFG